MLSDVVEQPPPYSFEEYQLMNYSNNAFFKETFISNILLSEEDENIKFAYYTSKGKIPLSSYITETVCELGIIPASKNIMNKYNQFNEDHQIFVRGVDVIKTLITIHDNEKNIDFQLNLLQYHLFMKRKIGWLSQMYHKDVALIYKAYRSLKKAKYPEEALELFNKLPMPPDKIVRRVIERSLKKTLPVIDGDYVMSLINYMNNKKWKSIRYSYALEHFAIDCKHPHPEKFQEILNKIGPAYGIKLHKGHVYKLISI